MWNAMLGSTILLWAVAGFGLLAGLARSVDFFHDDAYITLRYAQNFLAGNGIAWNAGDRVEGYTNFLQLLLVSGLGALGSDLRVATRIVAGASSAVLLSFLAVWVRRYLVNRPEASARMIWEWRPVLLQSLPLALVASSAPLIAWSFGGLEAPLMCALSTIGIALLREALRPGSAPSDGLLVGSGLALGLACLTRPDAGLFAALGVAFLLKPARDERSPRVLVLFAASIACVVGPWLVWKLVYYGGVLPNTYYVKATGVSWDRVSWGLRYVWGFALEPPFVLALLGGGALRSGIRRSVDRGSVYVLMAILSYVGWVVYVGGDQMPAYRLLVPILPTVAWLTLDLWLPDLRRLRDPMLCAVAIGLALLIGAASVPLRAPNLNSTAFVGTVVGRYIATKWPPGSLVALNTAGSTPYHAPAFRYVDMLGLNDAHIGRRDVAFVRIPGQRLPGHAKGDGAYVLARQPDYIILGPANGATASQPWFLSDLEIVEAPRFRRDYRLRQERLSVRDVDGFRDFPETSSGELAFTWYERRR